MCTKFSIFSSGTCVLIFNPRSINLSKSHNGAICTGDLYNSALRRILINLGSPKVWVRSTRLLLLWPDDLFLASTEPGTQQAKSQGNFSSEQHAPVKPVVSEKYTQKQNELTVGPVSSDSQTCLKLFSCEVFVQRPGVPTPLEM